MDWPRSKALQHTPVFRQRPSALRWIPTVRLATAQAGPSKRHRAPWGLSTHLTRFRSAIFPDCRRLRADLAPPLIAGPKDIATVTLSGGDQSIKLHKQLGAVIIYAPLSATRQPAGINA